MIPAIKRFLRELQDSRGTGAREKGVVPEHEIRLATAALLVETANSDYEFSVTEMDKLREILVRYYQLSSSEVEQLITQARSHVDDSISLDQFSRLLDTNLTPAEKVHVLELLWEVAFADGRVDKYEEYLIRKLADLLHVSHKGYISAKLKAEKAVKEQNA
ncbi:MAG: TerB family tellurite resistance protein [Chromatiales bacterium]|nr:TerB family tellurite resistance protein [Chromatiales bacterium]